MQGHEIRSDKSIFWDVDVLIVHPEGLWLIAGVFRVSYQWVVQAKCFKLIQS